MTAYRLPNGNLLVPKRAEGKGVLGDGLVEVGPDTPEYEAWTAYFERTGTKPPDHPERDRV